MPLRSGALLEQVVERVALEDRVVVEQVRSRELHPGSHLRAPARFGQQAHNQTLAAARHAGHAHGQRREQCRVAAGVLKDRRSRWQGRGAGVYEALENLNPEVVMGSVVVPDTGCQETQKGVCSGRVGVEVRPELIDDIAGRHGLTGDALGDGLDLVHHQVVQVDPTDRVGQVPLEPSLCHLRCQRRTCEPVEGLEIVHERGEETVCVGGWDELACAGADEPLGRTPSAATAIPVEGVATTGGSLDGADESWVPVCGPARDDQSVLVEDLRQESLPLRGVRGQLAFSVEGSDVLAVPVKFHDGHAAADQGRHAGDCPGGGPARWA